MNRVATSTDFTAAATSISMIAHTTTSPAVRLIAYPLTWEAFKKWYDKKYYPLNEKRFLTSGFENQQGFLLSYLKMSGNNLYVYWESKNEVWVACINSDEVEYNSDYDTALLAAITKGFHLIENQLENQLKTKKVA